MQRLIAHPKETCINLDRPMFVAHVGVPVVWARSFQLIDSEDFPAIDQGVYIFEHEQVLGKRVEWDYLDQDIRNHCLHHALPFIVVLGQRPIDFLTGLFGLERMSDQLWEVIAQGIPPTSQATELAELSTYVATTPHIHTELLVADIVHECADHLHHFSFLSLVEFKRYKANAAKEAARLALKGIDMDQMAAFSEAMDHWLASAMEAGLEDTGRFLRIYAGKTRDFCRHLRLIDTLITDGVGEPEVKG